MTMTDPAVTMPGSTAGHSGGGGLDQGAGHSGDGGPRRRRRGLWVTAAAGAAVVIALVVWAVWPAPTPTRKTTRPVLPAVKPLVGPVGGELVALLQAGQASTYHAVYHVSGDPTQIGGSQDFEVWNAPPRRRADTTRTDGGHTYRSRTFTDGRSTSLCAEQDSAPWSCEAVTGPSAGGADALSASVVAATSGQPVAVNDTTVSGRKVRCFSISTPSDTLRICATAAGVPVTIGNSAVTFQLVTLDAKVSAGVFKTPAAVHG
jgi:hypothetical protein